MTTQNDDRLIGAIAELNLAIASLKRELSLIVDGIALYWRPFGNRGI
jgi:hypothetical protein